MRLNDGIMVVPGTTVEKVLKCFEGLFGSVRLQKTPCEAGIQQEDQSQQLEPQDSNSYRSIIGLLLYLLRDRLDIMFTVKELSAAVSKPTLCALQRLKRLMGYLKFSGNIGFKLSFPEPGKGKRKEGCELEWLLETYCIRTQIGVQTRFTGNLPAVLCTSSMDATSMALQGLRKSSAFPQQRVNFMQWSVDAAMAFSSKDVQSLFSQLRCNTFSGQTIVLQDSWQPDRALDAYAICHQRSYGFNRRSLLEM